jgi:hypothetical protein
VHPVGSQCRSTTSIGAGTTHSGITAVHTIKRLCACPSATSAPRPGCATQSGTGSSGTTVRGSAVDSSSAVRTPFACMHQVASPDSRWRRCVRGCDFTVLVRWIRRVACWTSVGRQLVWTLVTGAAGLGAMRERPARSQRSVFQAASVAFEHKVPRGKATSRGPR